MPRGESPIDDTRRPAAPPPAPGAAELVSAAAAPLAPFAAERDEALGLLDDLAACGHDETARAAARYRAQLAGLMPSVTMIGQVKAGKTSLVNAMIGRPGLLPADVNPWTSVVTSLHLCPEDVTPPHAARFRFFDPEDWDRLTRKGGRVGELAGRSGAEEEAEKVRRQIEDMKEKTRRRLGRRFELLLGTSHDYGTVDASLIERYVCLGDDFFDDEAEDAAGAEDQGRFADITKAAELWLPQPGWPLGLTLRDTPGVNDTFMMREQITIGAIRDSRLCVVVLSAHQALSSVDMALIRLISNVRAREVVIFVNRIDELATPATQIAEIEASIRETLKANHGPEEVQVLFGSARWATLAMTGRLSDLDREEGEVLLAHAEHSLADMPAEPGALELVWLLSGVPALYDAIWTRILEGAARESLQTAARGAMNLAVGLSAAAESDPLRAAASQADRLDTAWMHAELEALQTRVLAQFDTALGQALDSSAARLERSHRAFLERATAALIRHLELYGEMSPWSYDPSGLRLLLRSGYQVFAKQLRTAGETAGQEAAAGVAAIYARALDRPADAFRLQAPAVPRLPAPVMLGQTIALDLQGTWWRRWWSRRRGYRAFAGDFHAMIEAETRPILDALRDDHCTPAGQAVRAALAEFFEDQRLAMAGLAARSAAGPGRPAPEGPPPEALAETVTRLGRLAA